MWTPRRGLAALLAVAVIFPAWVSAASSAEESAVWSALAQGGHVLVLRHSLDEPGNGDPHPLYRFGDCTYQRQLVAEGREQAGRLGQALQRRGIRIGKVFASEWCRTRDTALIAFGQQEPWAALNVLNPQTNPHMNAQAQTAAVLERIRQHQSADTLVLVTHWLNIQPLLGQSPTKGEGVVVRFDTRSQRLLVVGTLRVR